MISPNDDETPRIDVFEWESDGDPAIDVVAAVAEATDREILTLPSVSSAIDGDSLGDLLECGTKGAELVQVRFDYADVGVRITSDGLIAVEQ